MAEEEEGRVNPREMYQAGFEDGLQAGIDLAERLHEAWESAGSSNGLIRGAAIIAHLLKKQKEQDHGQYPGGTRGASAEGAEARVDGGRADGAVDEGAVEVADGSGGDVPSRGSSRSDGPTPEERLEAIRTLLMEPGEPNDFYREGFPNQYVMLAELYDSDFADALREAVEG